MKAPGHGILLLALVAAVAAVVVIWQWSAGDVPTPVAPGDRAAAGQEPAADAVETTGPTAASADVERRAVAPTAAAGPDPAAATRPEEAGVPDGPTVRGRVVDPRGRGIAAARVRVADDQLAGLPFAIRGFDDMLASNRTGVATDADGAFEVRLAARGPFRLVATHADHPHADYRGEADGDVDGVVITLRDGERITGSVVGVPADAQTLVVFARRLEGAIERVTTGALLDFGEIAEAMGAPLGAARAEVDAERRFELRGLDPDARYSIWAANATEAREMPVKCTSAVEFPAGTQGVQLVWREPLQVVVRVVDAETGAPIERLDVAAGFMKEVVVFGFSVAMPVTRPLPQKTFAGGFVRLCGLEVQEEADATLALEIRADGRQPWIRHDIAARAAGRIDLGTARLGRAAVVAVRVVDAGSGEPVAGATVQLVEVGQTEEEQGAGKSRSLSISTSMTADADQEAGPTVNTQQDAMRATTDARGECRITAEFTGTARLDVRADGRAPASSQPFEVDPAGEVAIEVPLHRGGAVRVTVLDGHGEPVPRAIVQRDGPTEGDTDKLTADADGQCTFEQLAIGEHSFRLLHVDAGKRGGLKVQLSGLLDKGAGTPVQVTDGVTAELRLVRPLRGQLAGFVMLDGSPLDRASVRLFAAPAADGDGKDGEENALAAEFLGSMLGGLVEIGHSAKTEVDGRFWFEDVPVGDYRVVVNHADLAMPEVRTCRIVEGDNRADVAIVMTIVRGRVVDGHGDPIAGATVRAVVAEGGIRDLTDQLGEAQNVLGELFGTGGGSSDGARTADDGTFELRGVRADVPLAIQATARRHLADSRRIDAVAAGATRAGVDFALAAAGCLRISAVGVRGAVAAKLRWAGPPGTDPPKDRDALLRGSRATVDDLVPGTWTVSVVGPGLPAGLEPRTVTVAAGATERVDFER